MSFTLADGETLKNRVGAKTHDELEAAEHPLLAVRLIELRSGLGPVQTFDKEHLQSLHRHLFQDVFEWAGELRHRPFVFADGTQAVMPTLMKIEGQPFAIGNQIDTGLDRLMTGLHGDNLLQGLERIEFADKAAEAFAALNTIHPFREGNGRTQREFFTALAEQAGHPINFDVISAERMTFVSVAAHERDDLAPMRRMFAEISDPERVNALEVAQRAIERFSPSSQTHASAWDNIYMATTEPGQTYEGQFAGAADPNFMLQGRDGSIIIGNTVDLPDPRPARGSNIIFIASGPDPVPAQVNLIEAKIDWPNTIAEAVALRMVDHPSLHDVGRRLYASAANVWTDPDRVAASLADAIHGGGVDAERLAYQIQTDPQRFGQLLGKQTVFGRDDDTRRMAVAALPLAVAALQDYGTARTALKSALTQQEARFRDLMREPIAELSPEARDLVARFAADRLNFSVSTTDEKSIRELRSYAGTMQARFAMSDGEIDKQRLAQALKDAGPERIESIAGIVQNARSVVARTDAISHGQSRAQSQIQSHDDGPGLSHGRTP
ncbi:MAG: Fic family protein [Agrobacterium sp.]|nr:Fic family protein [Agrobacterium sp.]